MGNGGPDGPLADSWLENQQWLPYSALGQEARTWHAACVATLAEVHHRQGRIIVVSTSIEIADMRRLLDLCMVQMHAGVLHQPAGPIFLDAGLA